ADKYSLIRGFGQAVWLAAPWLRGSAAPWLRGMGSGARGLWSSGAARALADPMRTRSFSHGAPEPGATEPRSAVAQFQPRSPGAPQLQCSSAPEPKRTHDPPHPHSRLPDPV